MAPSSSWKIRTGESGTLLGPLTAAWTPPSSCSVHVVNCPTCVDGYQAQHCVPGTASTVQDYTGCWPPATRQAGSPTYPFTGWGFYSPGVACPTGYTAACTAEYGGRPDWPIQFELFPGETAIGCCPTGFQCGNNDGNTCYAFASTVDATVVPTGTCSGTDLVGIVQATLPAAMTITETSATLTERPEFTLWAPMFQINHKSSDLESLSSESTPKSESTSSTPPPPDSGLLTMTTMGSDPHSDGDGANLPSSGSSPSPNPSVGAQNGGGGLSTGAVAGISVGAATGAIFLAAIVGCLWWRKRRQAAAAAAAALPEYPSSPGQGTANWVEADGGHSGTELPTKDALYYARPELESGRYMAELPSGGPHMPDQR